MDYTVFVENDNTFKELLRLSVDFPSDYRGKKCLEYIVNKAKQGEEKSREERLRKVEEILVLINKTEKFYVTAQDLWI